MKARPTKVIILLLALLITSLLVEACSGDNLLPTTGETETGTPATTGKPGWFSFLFPTPSPTLAPVTTAAVITAETPTSVPVATTTVAPTAAPTTETIQAEPTPVIADTPLPQTTGATTTAGPTTRATTAVKTPPKTTATTTAPRTPAPTTVAPPPRTTVAGGPYSEVLRGKTGKHEVAITFDAGSTADSFPKIINTLNRYGIKITFFLTGTWAQQNPAYVQQIANNGMEFGNHSWSHPDMTKVSDEQVRSEIQRTDDLLVKLTGHSSKPFFRFPYGARNQHLGSLINEMGYRSIYWTFDSLDSVGTPKSVDFLVKRITGQSDAELDGEIILMHIGAPTSADALPLIIENLQGRGFKVVPVSEIIK